MVPSSSSWSPSDPIGRSVSQLKGYYIISKIIVLSFFSVLKNDDEDNTRNPNLSNVWMRVLCLSILKLYYLAVPSSQLMLELTNHVEKLEGQCNCCVCRVTVHA